MMDTPTAQLLNISILIIHLANAPAHIINYGERRKEKHIFKLIDFTTIIGKRDNKTKYCEVSMRSLLLHPTSIAQWQGLILEAQHALSIKLHEELESYLVYLLMRFSGQPEVASSVLGLDFLEGSQKLNHNQPDLIRNVGDKCLLFAGLFPERAKKRRVHPDYFIQLGKSAYLSLATHILLTQQAHLFARLNQEFLMLTDILQATRALPHNHHDLMREIERWHETGSHLSWRKIQQATHALPAQEQQKPSNGTKKSFH